MEKVGNILKEKSIPKGLDDLEDWEDISNQKILMYMYNEKNLEMKSRITNPEALASLYVLGKVLNSYKLVKSPATIEVYLEIYLKYLISKDGMGRTELFKTISSLFDKETIKMSISERLTTNLSKK